MCIDMSMHENDAVVCNRVQLALIGAGGPAQDTDGMPRSARSGPGGGGRVRGPRCTALPSLYVMLAGRASRPYRPARRVGFSELGELEKLSEGDFIVLLDWVALVSQTEDILLC